MDCVQEGTIYLEILGYRKSRRMGYYGNVTLVLERQVERGRGTEAVSRRTDSGDTFCLERGNHRVDDARPGVSTVCSDPFLLVEPGWADEHPSVAAEEVRDDSPESITREVICEQLFDTIHAYHVL